MLITNMILLSLNCSNNLATHKLNQSQSLNNADKIVGKSVHHKKRRCSRSIVLYLNLMKFLPPGFLFLFVYSIFLIQTCIQQRFI